MKTFILFVMALMSLQSFAQRIEVGRDSKTFTVNPSTRLVNLNFSIPVYRYDYATRVVPAICYRTECSVEEGNGKQGDWKGYFNVPKEKKADALADAVKGIGKSTAEKIVRHDLLNHKPDSWSLFVKEINRIERKLENLGYTVSFAQEVIEVYGYENRVNLGYYSEQSCTKVPYDCYLTQVVEVKKKVREIPRDLEIFVSGQTLQSFEKDAVTVTVGNENNEVFVSSEGHNNYQPLILNRGSQLELTASRIMRAFPVNEVTVVTSKAGQRQIQVNAYIPQKFFNEDKDASLSMTIEICKSGFLGLGCTSQGVFTYQNVNTNTSKVFNLNGTGSYFARVFFIRSNSEYYSNAKSSVLSTSKIKF